MKRSGFKKPTKEKLAELRQKKLERVRSRKVTKLPSQRILKNKLWAECKRIVRERFARHDGTWNCYTCNAHLDVPVKAQTGHFIPSSVCSVHMRYHLDNLRVQCYRCNINLSGNWIEYEKRLNADGIDTVALKAENEATKNKQYDSLWYLAKIEEYKQL